MKVECNEHEEYTTISLVVGRRWDVVEVWNGRKLTFMSGP